MNDFNATFEMFDIKVRRLQNGNKLRVVLEKSEDIELEKQLIEFRGENVKAKISQQKNPESAGSIILVESGFEVFDLKCRRLKNGDKLSLILECMYDKKLELKLADLRFDDVILQMEKIDEELFDESEED